MRTIIAGGRDVTDYAIVEQALCNIPWTPSVVLSGGARGADFLGEAWATYYGIPIERYPADWEQFGKSAGYRRNAQMAIKADALVALWDGKSKGTKHMIDLAMKYGLIIYVHMIQEVYG